MKKSPDVVKTIPATKGRWEIYVSNEIILGSGKRSFVSQQYGTRLISRNGKIICGNTGFNSVRNAVKNIKAVRASA